MINWAYVAGFFDGEGSAVQTKPHIGTRISIVQADESVLQNIRKFLMYAGIPSTVRPRTMCTTYRKPQWRLLITKNFDSARFLHNVMPYLQVKRVLAQDLLRFTKLYPSLRGRVGGNQYAHW